MPSCPTTSVLFGLQPWTFFDAVLIYAILFQTMKYAFMVSISSVTSGILGMHNGGQSSAVLHRHVQCSVGVE